MIKSYDYEYDLYKQPFFSLPLDKDRDVVIKIKKSADLLELAGFSVKLNKYGKPGDISYAVGLAPGKDDLASGTISSLSVFPVLEEFVYVNFPPVAITGDIYITLKTNSGVLPLDGYRVFGPRQDYGEAFDDAEIPPYWWDTRYSFGMAVPTYYNPKKQPGSTFSCTVDITGSEGPSVSLRLFSNTDEKHDSPDPFSFLEKLFAPKYSEWHRLSSAQAPGENEVCLNSQWKVQWDEKLPATGLVKNIKEELAEFLDRCFGITPQGDQGSLIFHIDEALDVKGFEGHTLEVCPEKIEVTAKTPHGLMRALHFMEDIMLEKKHPSLEKGKYIRDSLYDLRMTSGIYPAPYNYFPLQTGEIWTEEYLWRLSRSGYNAAWGVANLEEFIENSRVLPGYGTPSASVALERLRRMTEQAEDYGVDFYIDLKTGYFGRFAEELYDKLPQLKTFEKWGNYPCTGVDAFRRLLSELITELVTKAPRLKGVMLIYDSEGFYSCFNHNRQLNCPNCKERTPQQLAAELFSDLLQNIRKSRDDAQIIAWTYYCDEQWNYDLIRELPEGVVMLSCFSQFVSFERYGVKTRTDDYACFVTGPGEYFEKVYHVSSEKGMPIIAKTEVSQGQEFVAVPYIPSLTQHQKRWDKLKEYNLSGFMGDYIHCNFKPSPCTDLMRLNLFDTRKDGTDWQNDQDKLRFVAGLNYGRASADVVMKAWELFSDALYNDFPYSPGVCRYPGPLQASPSQPFYLDPDRELKRVSARCNCPDLRWTELYFTEMGEYGKNSKWDAALVRCCFMNFQQKFEEGIGILKTELMKCEQKKALTELMDISEIMNCMVKSMINFIDFITLREKGQGRVQREDYTQMLSICETEMQNVERARWLCLENPQLGFSCEGQGTVRGGLFNLYTINEKKRELADTINELKLRIGAI